VILLFVVALFVIAGMCVLAIDVGRLMTCKAELQNAVDAASLAGASQLSGTLTEEERVLVRTEAKSLAAANTVDNTPLTLTDSDILFGHYDATTHTFTPEPEATVVDSVRITGRRTHSSPDGPINLFFGPIFGFDDVEFSGVVATGTKPRRYVTFVLDRSLSMCVDTTGVQSEGYTPPLDAEGPYMVNSASTWYWFPYLAMKKVGFGWQTKTAWFYDRDTVTGNIRTDFLPQHIQDRLDANRYFNFRCVDYPNTITSGWIKVPATVRIYGRYGSPWHNWMSGIVLPIIPSSCGYARSTGVVQPIQSLMDASSAFVDLLNANDDRCALVTYAYKQNLEQTLTTDFGLVRVKLQSLVPAGWTAEPDAIDAANAELIDSGRAEGYGQRVMILFTDGFANVRHETLYDNNSHTFTFLGKSITTKIHPTVAAAMEAATTRAKDNKVRIYCVTFGADSDTALHPEIAKATNAAYYHAEDHDDLTEIFVDIFRRLPPLLTQ
jgi:hypothetical protein